MKINSMFLLFISILCLILIPTNMIIITILNKLTALLFSFLFLGVFSSLLLLFLSIEFKGVKA